MVVDRPCGLLMGGVFEVVWFREGSAGSDPFLSSMALLFIGANCWIKIINICKASASWLSDNPQRHIVDTSTQQFRQQSSRPVRQLSGIIFPRKARLIRPRNIDTAMTTSHEMELSYIVQQQVIGILHETQDHDLATRLERCMTARQQRHYGDGWPYSCRSAACLWCRRPLVRTWWSGITYWSEAATTSSLTIIPLQSPSGLADAVRRLRRGLRDVRDRTARRRRAWRSVAFAGMTGGDHRALLLISHQGVDRREVRDALRPRWPDIVLKDLADEEPTWEMTTEDAADLGARRRGVEGLRVLIMPQRITRVTIAPVIEIAPMPVVV